MVAGVTSATFDNFLAGPLNQYSDNLKIGNLKAIGLIGSVGSAMVSTKLIGGDVNQAAEIAVQNYVFNLSLEVSGQLSGTLGKGVDGGGGVFVTNGGSSGEADAGIVASKGGGVGFGIGAGPSLDVYSGGRENIDGPSVTRTLCFFLCINVHYDTSQNLVGVGVSVGKGLPGGFTETHDDAMSVTVRDIKKR